MPIAAVPQYMQKLDPDFYLSSPPGHRFLLYFPVWGENGESKRVDWRMKDRVKKYKRQRGQLIDDGWTDLENGQFACTIAAGNTPPYYEETPRARRPRQDQGLKPWRPLLKALFERQRAAAATMPNLLFLEATATAPFTTGLGNEHPLENGFSFLWPYGLPYLPGSGVKGVLRKAAQELAAGMWGDSRGWSEQPSYVINVGTERKPRMLSLSMIDVLFGREPPKGDGDHVRGALTFWDVIPQIAGDSLMVEIMTPHQSHYYQQKMERKSGDSVSPHDSGQPNPIAFLTIPPGSTFAFHVVCDERHLARLTQKREGGPDLLQKGGDGKPLWQKLIEAAFEHAFQWLGFGAKTAVGYGAMRLATDPGANPSPAASGGQGAQSPKQPVSGSAPEKAWAGAKLTWKPGPGELTASFQGKVTMPLKGEQAQKLIEALGPRAGKLKKDKELFNVAVKVRKADAGFELVGLA